MFARRQAFDVEFDFYSAGGFRENGSSDTLALRVFDFHSDRFWRGMAANRMYRKPPGESDKAHRTGNWFHGPLSVNKLKALSVFTFLPYPELHALRNKL